MNLIVCILLFFIAGIVQYANFSGANPVGADDLVLWNMDVEEAQISSGIFSYAKDFFVLIFGIYWPLSIVRSNNMLVTNFVLKKYLPWIVIIFCIGLVGYLYNSNPYQFVLAGVRWLLLFHAAVGFFLMAANEKCHRGNEVSNYYLFLPVFCAINCFYVFNQLSGASSFFGIGLGAARVMGLFSNAAVSAFFSLAIAFVFVFRANTTNGIKLIVCAMCFYCGIGSGTRFVVICEVLLSVYVVYNLIVEFKGANFANEISLYVAPFVVILLYFGYEVLISSVDRGGIFEAAKDSDGRFGRLYFGLSEIISGDAVDLLFGGGIGAGTNTVYTMLSLAGYVPEKFNLNHLVDNGFLTILLQLGVIGFLVFFLGICSIISECFSRCRKNFVGVGIICFSMFVTMFAGSPFDHYYLMIGFGLGLGFSVKDSLRN